MQCASLSTPLFGSESHAVSAGFCNLHPLWVSYLFRGSSSSCTNSHANTSRRRSGPVGVRPLLNIRSPVCCFVRCVVFTCRWRTLVTRAPASSPRPGCDEREGSTSCCTVQACNRISKRTKRNFFKLGCLPERAEPSVYESAREPTRIAEKSSVSSPRQRFSVFDLSFSVLSCSQY